MSPLVSSSLLGWPWRLFGSSNDDSTRVQIPREPRQGDALQYGPVTGLAPSETFIQEFVKCIYAPTYADWTMLIDMDNTDGSCVRVVSLVLSDNQRVVHKMESHCNVVAQPDNPGDSLLVEEWSHPSAQTALGGGSGGGDGSSGKGRGFTDRGTVTTARSAQHLHNIYMSFCLYFLITVN